MTSEVFEKLVAEAIDALPERVVEALDNVAVCIEDDSEDGECLGEYVGISQIERDDGYSGVLPDQVILYQDAIEDECEDDPDRIREEIGRTLWHEIAHHFGWEDDAVYHMEEKKGWRGQEGGRG
ncbi:metallopeptidase family protein [Candidatus Uhrbacteria bacterium]|nr:metallopeptidase family protein [Candidatus Uhrbacteria bacterium]